MTAGASTQESRPLFRFIYREDATENLTLESIGRKLRDLQHLLRVAALVSMHLDPEATEGLLHRFGVSSLRDIPEDRLLENVNEVRRFPVTSISYRSPMELTLWFTVGGAAASAGAMLAFGHRLIDIFDKVQRSRTTQVEEGALRARARANHAAYDRLAEALSEADMSPELRGAVDRAAEQLIRGAAVAALELDRIEPVGPDAAA